jgi:uncharacterized membrane protein YedE/YeeE
MRRLVMLIAGALFGIGLIISDMINPARVLAFLDVAGGAWDPTLAFVMIGALIPMAIAWRVAARRTSPAFAAKFPDPPPKRIDAPLIAGSGLFGMGWGLVGFCPGPALAALGLGGWQTLLFVAAMLVSMLAHSIYVTQKRAPSATSA